MEAKEFEVELTDFNEVFDDITVGEYLYLVSQLDVLFKMFIIILTYHRKKQQSITLLQIFILCSS